MSEYRQGPDWWKASDDKWYPPDQLPGEPVAEGERPPAPSPARRQRPEIWLAGIGFLLVAGLVVTILVGRANDDSGPVVVAQPSPTPATPRPSPLAEDAADQNDEPEPADDDPTPEAALEPEPMPEDAADHDDEPEPVDDDPTPEAAPEPDPTPETALDPEPAPAVGLVAVGDVGDIAEGWAAQVAGVELDPETAAVAVEARAGYEPDDPTGRWVLVDLTVAYGGDDAATPFDLFAELDAGGEERLEPFGCPLPPFPHVGNDVFPGAAFDAQYCFDVPDGVSDESLVLYVSSDFRTEVPFSLTDVSASPSGLELLSPEAVIPAGGPVGSRGNPIPFGDVALANEVELSVTGVEVATDLEQGAPPSMFGEYVVIEAVAERVGDIPDVGFGPALGAVSADGLSHSPFVCPFQLQGGFFFADELEEIGDEETTTLCVDVSVEQAETLQLYASWFDDEGQEQIFFALR